MESALRKGVCRYNNPFAADGIVWNPPAEVCAVLTRKNCFLFSQEGAFFLAIGGAVLYNLYYVELCAEKELSMEKLLVFIPAYNCEKQVTRVLSQLLDQRIAPWVGECSS